MNFKDHGPLNFVLFCFWLRGQDLLKTLQLVLGYEVVAEARNRRYLHLNFAPLV